MKIKAKVLEAYLRRNQITKQELARDMDVSPAEVDEMLDGKALSADTARKFIRYFGSGAAERHISKTETDENQIGELLDENERYSDEFGDDDKL